MKIVDIGVKVFTYKSNQVHDSEGHSHPGPEHDALQALVTITADDGTAGYCFGPAGSVRQVVIDQFVKPELDRPRPVRSRTDLAGPLQEAAGFG